MKHSSQPHSSRTVRMSTAVFSLTRRTMSSHRRTTSARVTRAAHDRRRRCGGRSGDPVAAGSDRVRYKADVGMDAARYSGLAYGERCGEACSRISIRRTRAGRVLPFLLVLLLLLPLLALLVFICYRCFFLVRISSL